MALATVIRAGAGREYRCNAESSSAGEVAGTWLGIGASDESSGDAETESANLAECTRGIVDTRRQNIGQAKPIRASLAGNGARNISATRRQCARETSATSADFTVVAIRRVLAGWEDFREAEASNTRLRRGAVAISRADSDFCGQTIAQAADISAGALSICSTGWEHAGKTDVGDAGLVCAAVTVGLAAGEDAGKTDASCADLVGGTVLVGLARRINAGEAETSCACLVAGAVGIG